MANVYQHIRSATPSAAPTTSDLLAGEIGVNTADGKLFVRTDAPAIKTFESEDLFVKLAGRSGGQTLIGGTASGDDVTLQSTSHATKGTINLSDPTVVMSARDYPTGGFSTGMLDVSPTISNVNNAVPQLIAVRIAPTYEYDTAISAGFATIAMMHFAPTLKSESGMGAGSDTVNLASFFCNPSFDGTNGPRTINQLFGVLGRPRIAGGTGTTFAGLRGTVEARNAATITTGYGLYVSEGVKDAGATITTLVGLRVDSLTAATTNWGIQVAGTMKSYHQGDLMLGAASAPGHGLDIQTSLGFKRTSVSNAAYTVLTTDLVVAITSMTTGRTFTLPPAAAAGDRKIYVFKNETTSGFNLSINQDGSETIDGSTGMKTLGNLASLWLYCTGTAWFSI